MKKNKKILGWGVVFALFIISFAGAFPNGQPKEIPKTLAVMKEEMQRNFDALQKEQILPYFMSYSIDQVSTQMVTGSFGAVSSKDEYRSAYLQIDVRVGSYHLDNSHELRGDPMGRSRAMAGGSSRAPLDEAPEALQVLLWQGTDRAYKNALDILSRVKSEKTLKVEEEDKSDDFSKVEPHTAIAKPLTLKVDLEKWSAKVRKYSEPFKAYPFMMSASASFVNEVRNKYLVNTEGTMILTPVNYMRLQISAVAKGDDGMEFPLYASYFGFQESDLPSDDRVLKDVDSMAATLEKLRAAPLVDPYTGPAILSGKASGVFFHEILGHRMEGHRQKSAQEGQTFKKKVGELVLPDFVSVVFDPTLKELGGFKLSGYYEFDEEGTKAEKVDCIDKGIMKDFLMSRTPIENFSHSNGHARGMPGMKPVCRQSNLIVESTKKLDEAKLRRMLIEECTKQNKPFGLVFQEIAGGFTQTGRTMPNAFNVTPLVVYRVHTDGRPDELVRGVDLIGTPLTTFSRIIATGSQLDVFNGMCGAESGSVPVSAVSPSILVSEIEVQKKAKSQEKLPILPPPPVKK